MGAKLSQPLSLRLLVLESHLEAFDEVALTTWCFLGLGVLSAVAADLP